MRGGSKGAGGLRGGGAGGVFGEPRIVGGVFASLNTRRRNNIGMCPLWVAKIVWVVTKGDNKKISLIFARKLHRVAKTCAGIFDFSLGCKFAKSEVAFLFGSKRDKVSRGI